MHVVRSAATLRNGLRLWVVVLCLVLLSGCGTSLFPRTKTLYLNHYLEECIGVALTLCSLERETPDGAWTFRYDGVRGFEYEWGFVYELRVAERDVLNPPADASSIETSFIEVVRKTKVSPETRFQIALTTKEGGYPVIEQKAANLFEFHGTKAFICASEALCTEIADLIEQELRLVLEFTHPEAPGEPLIAQRLVRTEEPRF